MKTFRVNEIRDFAAAIVDEAVIQTVIQWVADNVEPDDVYDKERLLDYARDFLCVERWECGCGHVNGANLDTCAACQRPPGCLQSVDS